MTLVSSRSTRYSALSSAGGPSGRNCHGVSIAQGVMVANCGTAPGANAGGVGRHWPGARPPRNGGGGVGEPSAPRPGPISSATPPPPPPPPPPDPPPPAPLAAGDA